MSGDSKQCPRCFANDPRLQPVDRVCRDPFHKSAHPAPVAATPEKCPNCYAPEPNLYPVDRVCRHPFHKSGVAQPVAPAGQGEKQDELAISIEKWWNEFSSWADGYWKRGQRPPLGIWEYVAVKVREQSSAVPPSAAPSAEQEARECAEQIVADVFPSMDSACATRYVEQATQRIVSYARHRDAEKDAQLTEALAAFDRQATEHHEWDKKRGEEMQALRVELYEAKQQIEAKDAQIAALEGEIVRLKGGGK